MKGSPNVALEITQAILGQSGKKHRSDVFQSLLSLWKVVGDELTQFWKDPSHLHVFESSGKGGAFFASTSQSPLSLVKSINRAEAKLLFETGGFLDHYVQHLTHYPESLIMRIYGVFTTESGVHFLLMENVLHSPVPIARTYDLKGSMVHRLAPKEKSTQLDKNWIHDGRFLYVGSSRRDFLLDQVRADSDFLAAHNLMDYSLLVGIIERPESQSRAQFSQLASGNVHAYLAPDGEVLYLLGVIDFLQEYNAKKKLAHAIKATYADSAQLSTVAPDAYSSRFVEFIRLRVLDDANHADDFLDGLI